MKNVILSIAILCCSGCFTNHTNVYAPTINRITTVKAKKELIGSFGHSNSEFVYRLNGNIKYSPIKNTGVQANFEYGGIYKAYGLGIGRYTGSYSLTDKGTYKGHHFDFYFGYNFNHLTGAKNKGGYTISRKSYYHDFAFNYRYQVISAQAGAHFSGRLLTLDLAIRPSIVDILSVNIWGDPNPSQVKNLTPLNDDPFF